MKSITDKVKNLGKGVKKAAAVGTIVLGSYFANAQGITSTYVTPMDNVPAGVEIVQDGKLHVETQILPVSERENRYEGMKIFEGIDLYNAPMNHVNFYGKNKLDYPYSGDVNNDEVIDQKDVNAIVLGEYNERADVDCDLDVDSEDKRILQERVDGTRERLLGEAYMKNGTKAEKDSLVIAIARNESNNIYEVVQVYGGHCDEIADYILSSCVGIKYFDVWNQNLRIPDNNGRYNLPVVRIDTEAIGGSHAINGIVSLKEVNTNMTNILDFKNNFSKFEPTLNKIQKIGDNYLKSYANVMVHVPYEKDGKIYFSSPQINFILEEGNSRVTNFDDRYILTNPKAIRSEFENMDTIIVNYLPNLNLDTIGVPNFSTNVDIDSELKIGDIAYLNRVKNVIKRTIVEGEKIPLSDDPELENIYYEQNKETIIGEFQHSNNGIIELYYLLKEVSKNIKVIVDDFEKPKITNFVFEETNNYIEEKDWNNELSNSLENKVTDNSGLKVSKNFIENSTQVMNETINQINYDIYTQIQLTDKRGNMEIINHLRHVRDLESPVVLNYSGEEEINFSEGVDLEEINKNYFEMNAIMTDNSNLDVNTSFNSSSTRIMDAGINQVNYDFFTTAISKDLSGNEVENVRKLKVRDFESPVVSFSSEEEVINFEENLDLEKRAKEKFESESKITDNSNLPTFVSYESNSTRKMDGGINQVNYDYIFTSNVEDVSGNKTVVPQTLRVRDIEAPYMEFSQKEYLIKKGVDPLSPLEIIVSDNSNLDVSVQSFVDSTFTSENWKTHYITSIVTDVAGNSSTASTIVIEDINTSIRNITREESLIKIYPNPINGNATIVFTATTKPQEIELVNLCGERIKTITTIPNQKDKSILSVSFSDVSNGIYFLIFKNIDKVIATKKIEIKNMQ